jgi:hypothetical protein
VVRFHLSGVPLLEQHITAHCTTTLSMPSASQYLWTYYVGHFSLSKYKPNIIPGQPFPPSQPQRNDVTHRVILSKITILGIPSKQLMQHESDTVWYCPRVSGMNAQFMLGWQAHSLYAGQYCGVQNVRTHKWAC